MSNVTATRPRMKVAYHESVVPEMLKRFNLQNPMQVPRLVKVVVNMGVNDAKEDIKSMDAASAELALITGQKPQVRRAKKSISNFKLRQGMPIGVRVTLRGTRMFEFLDRFINTAIPRIRDFRGLDPRAFDGRGNYNLGLTEQHIFPEVDLEKSPKLRGFNVTIVTTAGDDAKARELLALFGMPFKTPEKDVKKPIKKLPAAEPVAGPPKT